MRKCIKSSLYLVVLSFILISFTNTNYCILAEANFVPSSSESPFEYVRWSQDYIEALVRATPPPDAENRTESIANARDLAMDKLHYDLVEFILGAHLDAVTQISETITSDTGSTTVSTKSTEIINIEVKKNEISKVISKNIELVKEEWDGDFYIIYGRIPLSEISAFLEVK